MLISAAVINPLKELDLEALKEMLVALLTFAERCRMRRLLEKHHTRGKLTRTVTSVVYAPLKRFARIETAGEYK